MAQFQDTNILYITHRFPYPLDKGERIRCAHMLRVLSKVARIDVISFADEPVHPRGEHFVKRYAHGLDVITVSRLGQYFRMSAGLLTGRSLTESAFAVPRARHLIQRCLKKNRYDCVIISSSGLYPLVKELVSGSKLIVDMMDVDSRKWLAYAQDSFWLRAIYLREARCIRHIECAILSHVRAVLLTTTKELSFLPAQNYRRVCTVVGNGVDCDFFRPANLPSTNRHQFAFLGALNYWPNVEGLAWFLVNIWPIVRQDVPEAAFSIVGRKPNYQVRYLAHMPNVKLYSDVPDIRPIMLQCGIAVFPLRLVFGIPNKVLEAMALGRACIVSEEIASIIGGTSGLHYLVARNISDWVRHIRELYNRPGLVDELACRGRQLVMEKYSWEKQLAPVIELIKFIRTKCLDSWAVSE